MTYDSTRGNASLRHEINNSLTLISSRLQLLAARYVFLKEDSDFTEIQNDLSDIQRLLITDRTARQPQLTLCSLQPLLNELYTSFCPFCTHSILPYIFTLLPICLPYGLICH